MLLQFSFLTICSLLIKVFPYQLNDCHVLTEYEFNGSITEDAFEQNCLNLTIIVPAGYKVQLNITIFRPFIAEAANVSVYDGTTVLDRLLKGVSKENQGFKIVESTQDTMFAIFRVATNQNQSGGFQLTANYGSLKAESCNCPNHTFNDPIKSKVIKSPLFPNNYCNNLNCSYLIQVNSRFRVKLDFSYIFTQEEHDYIILYDGPTIYDNVFANYTGYCGKIEDGNHNYTSSSNEFLLHLISDGSITHAGFEASFDYLLDLCDCPAEKYLDQHNYLHSPGFPYTSGQCTLWHEMNRSCSYWIVGQEHQIIDLAFSTLDLNSDSLLVVYDGANENGTLLFSTSNWSRLIIPNITSKGNQMYIELTLDLTISNSINNQGFEGQYWLKNRFINTTPKDRKTNYSTTIIFGVIGGAIVSIALAFLIWKLYRRTQRKKLVKLMGTFINRQGEGQDTQILVITPIQHLLQGNSNDNWEIYFDRLQIDFDQKLGSGAFGEVYKATLLGNAPSTYQVNNAEIPRKLSRFTNCTVAVKMLNENANIYSKEAFITEINNFKEIGYCQYLVNFLGSCTKGNLCLVMEYCQLGNLLNLVKELKTQGASCVPEFNSFSWQVASGMEFLSSKNCIHRDIAARNILIDGERRAKISDFGLCRLLDDNVYIIHGGRLPVKWMAIESLRDNEYTTKSDVWSYGVLLFEMYSFGEQPFRFIDAKDLLGRLIDGERLDKPDHCPQQIYDIMTWCWCENAKDRPSFEKIKEKLEKVMENYYEDDVTYLPVESSLK